MTIVSTDVLHLTVVWAAVVVVVVVVVVLLSREVML